MKVSPKYKRFKRINFVGDTLPLPDKRSSIIRTMQGYQSHTNTDDLKRLEKEAQNKGNETQKTGRTLSVSDRALFVLLYADMIARPGGHTARPDGYVLHGQVFKKSNLHLNIEMEKHFLVYYSYERKYHKLASMNIPGYQCSNIYIDIEKGTLLNKDIQ